MQWGQPPPPPPPPHSQLGTDSLKHTSCHAHHRLIPSLHNPILFRCVRCSQVSLHTLLDAVVDEITPCKLPTTIGAECPQLPSCFSLGSRLECDECC
jgi:hypothetical protein